MIGGDGIPTSTVLALATGGSQIAGGLKGGESSGGYGTDGRFGIAGLADSSWGSSGGGGYYGGGGGGYIAGSVSTGAGGSSYISGYLGCIAINKEDGTPKVEDNPTLEDSYHDSGKIFTNTIMKAGNEEIPSSRDTGTAIGNSGNGYIKITLIY